MPVVLDSGASFSVTPFREDFVSPIRVTSLHELTGINGSSNMKGIGTIEWTIRDVFGTIKVIRTEAYLRQVT